MTAHIVLIDLLNMAVSIWVNFAKNGVELRLHAVVAFLGLGRSNVKEESESDHLPDELQKLGLPILQGVAHHLNDVASRLRLLTVLRLLRRIGELAKYPVANERNKEEAEGHPCEAVLPTVHGGLPLKADDAVETLYCATRSASDRVERTMGEFPKLPLTPRAVHLCVDMQRLFWPGAPWGAPWVATTLPTIVRLVEFSPDRTVFTRFIPPVRPEEASGMWRLYYERWREITRERLAPELTELLPELARFAPPAHVLDKAVYSAFGARMLLPVLGELGADTLVVSGSESDVCVLATVLSAVDYGFRVIVARDAICSSSDQGHDNIVEIYRKRYTEQIEVADTDEIIGEWSRAKSR